jgi:hypothetical protein
MKGKHMKLGKSESSVGGQSDSNKFKRRGAGWEFIFIAFQPGNTQNFECWTICKYFVLAFVVTISVTLTGCASYYTPSLDKTTFGDLKQKLGAPDKQITYVGDIMRVRWWRSAFSGASLSGQQVSVALTYYDGEFGPGGLLHRWRAVANDVPLDESYGFGLTNVDWSVGYLTHDNNFVDEHGSGTLRKMGLPDYREMQIGGVLYSGQIIDR